jgi:hypothetical protein
MDPGHVLYHLCMSQYFRSVSRSRRSGGVLLLVGVLAGVTVGGGVGVIAASSTKTVTVCADKKTGMLRYAKNGKCTKTETKVLLNQTGADGVAGATGATGAKGETGAKGTDGAPGADGVNGVNGAAGSSFSARSVCGLDGATLCEVGVQGPGGGIVFFVDTEGKYGDFDYLEVAPDDLSAGIPWSTASVCGPAQNASCFSSYLTTSGEALNFLAIGTGRAATAAIVARHASVSKGSYAAGVADEYATTTASDWWLPSRDELNELCKYARDTNQVAGSPERCQGGTIRNGFAGGLTIYWSSSEGTADFVWAHAFNYQPGYAPTFNESHQSGFYKTSLSSYVRPVRGF